MNWYKIAQNQIRIKENILIWLEQANTGNVQPDIAMNDIESIMGGTIDPQLLMMALTQASQEIEIRQGFPITPQQSQLIESFRSYLDETQVGEPDMGLQPMDQMEEVI